MDPKGPQGYGVPFSKFDPPSYFKAAIKWHMAMYIYSVHMEKDFKIGMNKTGRKPRSQPERG